MGLLVASTPVNVLVVHAHPAPTSFNRALFETAVRALERAGHTVDALDLYGEGFDPRMTPEERRAYHTDVPIVSADVERHATLVRRAEALVFVYPTWWNGLPAMLKGWMERVLVPGVAFTFDPVTHEVRRGLTNVRRIVGITTYGSPRAYVVATADGGRRTLNRTLRLVCHRYARTRWLALYRLDTATVDDRLAFLERVERSLARL
jgi:putative NADPH-quinone reductase